MNRRSFFARMLGAACFAVADRVLPSSIAGTVKPMFAEPFMVEDAWWLRERIEVVLFPTKDGQVFPCEIHVVGESGRTKVNPPGFDVVGCNDYDHVMGTGSWEPFAGHRYATVQATLSGTAETFEQSTQACAAEHAETLRRLAD